VSYHLSITSLLTQIYIYHHLIYVVDTRHLHPRKRTTTCRCLIKEMSTISRRTSNPKKPPKMSRNPNLDLWNSSRPQLLVFYSAPS
jgi:hypothetical protein